MLHCGYSQQQINLSQELCLLAIQAPFIHQDCASFNLLQFIFYLIYFNNDLKHNISHYMKAITILYRIRERRRKRGGKDELLVLGSSLKACFK